MRHRLARCILLVALGGTAMAPFAAAAEPTASDKETARSLVIQGRAKLAAGDVEGALRALEAAHAIMGVPTTGLDLAKAQAAAGLLVEARATALEVTRMRAAPGEPPAFTRARPLAAQLAERLAARIPSLVVRVTGPAAARVLVDGAAVPAEALGLPRKLNPGDHAVVATAPGFLEARRSVSLAEGEVRSLAIALEPDPAGGGPSLPAWAWASGAAGLAALGASVAFAVDHAAVRRTVARDCPSGVCDLERYDDDDIARLRSRWDRDVGLAVGFGVGTLAGIGTAIYGIVTARAARPRDTAMAPWLTLGAGGVRFGAAF